jgi:antitoxin HicB
MTSTSNQRATSSEKQTLRYSVVLNWDVTTNAWEVTVPALNGAVTCGDTVEQALEMARDLICINVEDMQAHGESIPREDVPVQLHSIDIAIA